MQSCRSQLHTILYLPTTIPLVVPICGLHYTCGHHLCTVWLPHNISPSSHICPITSTVSRFLLTIWLPNSRLHSTYRELEITINRDIYKHVPWYHVQYWSQCIQHSVNQFSYTQLFLTTVAYDKLRRTTVTIKLKPISILYLQKPSAVYLL